MRATLRDQIGNVGETEVAAQFERLGWGVAPNPRHDLGTDLWLMARDERLFDLGLVVGAQVKSGASYFTEEERDASGAVVGWWFRDTDRAHVDAWLTHGLPHVVVLHDLDTGTSYWVHIVDEAVVSTGKGAKVLVPADSTLDQKHRDALLKVAAAKRSGGAWEGSAWTGAGDLPPRDLLRHALIVPRLVAPHPNAGHEIPVTAAQALALVVQARLTDLHELAEAHDSVPSLQEATASPDWGWRFVGAMGQRVTLGQHELLVEVALDAPDPASRTAATVAAAATMLEDGLPDDALERLDAALELDDAEPIDHVWLLVQRARACAEIGRLEEARAAAAQIQTVGTTHAPDVTATAIAGVAAVLLFNASGWGQQDVADVVTGADTTAAWWRTQTVSRALTALTNRVFWAWSADTTVRWSSSDTANDQLLSAALTASYAGDHATWRRLMGLIGQDQLLRLDRNADPERARSALETLRISGNSDELKKAVRRLAEDGPAMAVTLAAAQVDLNLSTRTTGPTDLVLLQEGGDLLDEASAEKHARWLLTALDDPESFVARTTPAYLVGYRLLEVLAAVAAAATAQAQRLIAQRLCDLPPQTDQLIASSWEGVARALSEDAWDAEDASRLGRTADGHHRDLRLPLLSIAGRFDNTVREQLLEEARTGSLDALNAFGDVRQLPKDVVRVLIAALAARVEGQVADAHHGRSGFGRHDVGEVLALLNIWHSDLAEWQPLLHLIEDPLVTGGHKRGALLLLARNAGQVPDDVKTSLLQAARAAAAQPSLPWSSLFGESQHSGAPAAELVAALMVGHDHADPEAIASLVYGGVHDRVSAARIARRRRSAEDIGALLVLSSDPDPDVRANAAFGLAQLVADGTGSPAALASVRRSSRDPGRRAPQAVAAALSASSTLSVHAAAVLSELRSHPSAAVRRAAEIASAN